MNVDVRAWAIFFFWCLVIVGALLRLMLEGFRQIEHDAVPATGRTVFGRLWSLQDRKP